MPRGESEGCELGWARAGAFMVFPHRQLVIFRNPPVKRMASRARSEIAVTTLYPPRHCTAATSGTKGNTKRTAPLEAVSLRRRWAVSHGTRQGWKQRYRRDQSAI